MEFHKDKAVISQKAIITRNDGKILMLQRHADDMSRPDGWDFPGGALEDTEEPTEGIKREVQEETGLPIKNIVLLEARSIALHDGCWSVLLTYSATVDVTDVVISHEHQEYTWVTKNELLRMDIPDRYKKAIK